MGWEVVQVLFARVWVVRQDILIHDGNFVKLSYSLLEVAVVLIHEL